MGASHDAQAAADKECRRLCKKAKEIGGTVPFSLSRMIDAKVPLSTIRKVLRG
ncbi:hypothetical protein D3C76_469100 [compost metagenome]